jgi:hypothetical protein
MVVSTPTHYSVVSFLALGWSSLFRPAGRARLRLGPRSGADLLVRHDIAGGDGRGHGEHQQQRSLRSGSSAV